MPVVPINVSALGNNNLGIAPAVSSQFIRVRAVILVAAAAVSVTLKDSGTGVFSGAIPLGVNGQLILPFAAEGYFDCAQTKDVNIFLSAAVAVTGFIDYDIHG